MKILAIGDFHGKFPERLKKQAQKVDLIISVGDYTGIKDWRPIIMARMRASRVGQKIPKPAEVIGKKKFNELLKKDFNAGKFILTELNNLGKKIFLIFGNSDDEWYKYLFDKKINLLKKRTLNIIKKLKNIKIITYGKVKFKAINFIGFGGYMDIDSYFNKTLFKKDKYSKRTNRIKKSRKKLLDIINKTRGDRVLIFHYPPAGAFDIIHDKTDNPLNNQSAGISFFAEIIKKYKPLFVLCGHMHEYQGLKRLYGIPVINPGAAVDGKAAIIDFNEESKKIRKVQFIK
ncbi:hypothetical protein A3K82_00785 [Candidatus Pacearchaeota archaeon RBG_19FT_COMBO_34_9]|nr:MAG: hypothetical protein A3K82_00785 [Candidatus Pacearchaeota archaeon RBG_19FT_COMBO_34_9]OGJ16568.1 MAG: hypothetical protein A3K74_00490 [Candidatus Pacearchaeota archaeon RBG_13_33_26]